MRDKTKIYYGSYYDPPDDDPVFPIAPGDYTATFTRGGEKGQLEQVVVDLADFCDEIDDEDALEDAPHRLAQVAEALAGAYMVGTGPRWWRTYKLLQEQHHDSVRLMSVLWYFAHECEEENGRIWRGEDEK